MKRLRTKLLTVLVLFSVFALSGTVVTAQGVSFEELTAATVPWDAVPSPDGSLTYFTALNVNGSSGVFSIAAGQEPTLIESGRWLVMPLGIAISTDGQTLYVTDPWSAGGGGNGLYALSPTDATPAQLVPGTAGTMPQGVEVASTDAIYFTGIDPADGQAAVYRVAAAGGTAEMLVKGAPLIAPSGLAIAQDGTIYVLDHLASGNGLGAVLRIQGTTVEIIARDVRTGGQLAGITLPTDESVLMVSSLDHDTGTAQVLVINLATLETSIVNEGISTNTGAGGLHRAHNANIFAWADSTGGPPGGKVFTVKIKEQ